MSRKLLVTGGAGFIGSAFVRYWLRKWPEDRMVVLDALTYAGNLANLAEVWQNPRFRFYPGRIEDTAVVEGIFRAERPTHVLNFAAESHNDRSLLDPTSMIASNVTGVSVLMAAGQRHGVERFLQVSTDEVYGEITHGKFLETDALLPRTPYSASKAGGELQVRAYVIAFGAPAVITRGSNTFGPYQYPEKLLPFFITRALQDKALPLYGEGNQVREWLYVDDHCSGIETVLLKGSQCEAYNVGGGTELTNLELTRKVLAILGKPETLIKHIPDPRGAAHDVRYAMDCSKIAALGWKPAHNHDEALERTVRWYVDRRDWWEPIVQSAEYQSFVRRFYGPALGDLV